MSDLFENCYFLIPARKGSKGFPFKNRALFDDTANTIPSTLRNRVFVSTNDEAIIKKGQKYNFNIIKRPDLLSEDGSSLKGVLKHFIEIENIGDHHRIIMLFLTYPERTWADIENIYQYFIEKGAKSLICAEQPIDHPYLCFVEKEKNRGQLLIEHVLYRRQDYPRCMKHSMFFSCYEVSVVNKLHDLMFEKDTVFYKLKNKKIDVDYEEDYTNSKPDERFEPMAFNIPFKSFLRHFERYFKCVELLGKVGKNEKWLDCACGTGYGTNLLTNFASNVVGYDINKEAVEYANKSYKTQNCSFTYNLNFYEECFDTIISVETVEHMPIEDAKGFLNTLKKSLKQEGSMIITTPIVKNTNNNPTNKFHFVEYSDDDFRQLLSEQGFEVLESNFIKTTFTDGETKDQGYYKCKKQK